MIRRDISRALVLTSLAATRCSEHCPGELSLDNAFALIEGHPCLESVKKPGGTGTPVFSLMTSFTGRYQDILYTSLRRGLRERALVRGLDGMGNGGHRRAAGAFCGEREPWGKNDAGTVPGV